MKFTLTLILTALICFTSEAQDTKNELSVGLTSLYVSPRSNNTDRNIGGIYPLSGLKYARHLAKFSLFVSYQRYTGSSIGVKDSVHFNFSHTYGEIGDDISRSHNESSAQFGIKNISKNNKTFSPIASASFIFGRAKTKLSEYDGPIEIPAYRDLSYQGINSSLGIRYNLNKSFHVDLTTQVGIVRTKGSYKVFENHQYNPTVFEYDESGIVPVFTLAQLSVGINF